MFIHAATLLVFPALMAFAASSDLITMRISNWVALALVAGFVGLAPLLGLGAEEILAHVGAGFAVLAVAFGCFVRGWIGGGDAKLAAATALWLGFDHLLVYLVYASLFGGLLTLLILKFRAFPLPPLLLRQEWLRRLHRPDCGVPYGLALAAAALVVYPQTVWMQALVP